MAKRDYYDVLGIQKNASDTEIKKAFRTLAKENHPDSNQGDAGAETRFKEISEAYENLKDPQTRAAYDQFGHAGTQAGGMGVEWAVAFLETSLIYLKTSLVILVEDQAKALGNKDSLGVQT